MSPKAGPNDESRERTRAALLEAGADLLVARHKRNPFAGMTVREICEHAGYSAGSLYEHWDSADAYFDELGRRLAADDAFDGDVAELLKAAEGSAGLGVLAAVALVADLDLQLLLGNPSYDAQELLNVTLGRGRLQQEMARGYRVFDHDTGEVYRKVLARGGRVPRPPLDWDQIGVMLQALLEGVTLRHKVDPAAVPLSSESALGPYATAVAAVLAVVTRPAAGDDASLGEALQALLDGRDPPTATAAPAAREAADGRHQPG
jgi:AcrR family transcriptional regulator